MLDAYIKATAGTVSWLLFMVLELCSPIIKGVCWFLSLGFFGFLFMLYAGVANGFDTQLGAAAHGGGMSVMRYMFFFLATSLIGMSGLIFFEIKMLRMFYARLWPEEDQGNTGWFIRFRNILFMLALLAAFTYAARHFYPKLNFLEWPAIGFAWWLAAGVALGIVSCFFRSGIFTKVRFALVPKKTMTLDEAKAYEDAHKVVPFRRNG